MQICAVHDPSVVELTTVENVSRHGARLTTWRYWEPGIPMLTGRSEKRNVAAVAVMLTSLELASRTELTFTENISSGGARVITGKLWLADDPLVIKSLEGDLQSEAKVVYRQSVREKVYAIGVKLIEPTGQWRTRVQR